jgi:PEP-CTERM motif
LFDNRIGGSDYINGYPVTQFYDTHTDGSFSTAGAVPEPSTWAMLLLGFVGLGVMIRRRTPADRVLAQ